MEGTQGEGRKEEFLQMRLHSLLALIAFHSDAQLVFNWLRDHGEPFLDRSTSVGDSKERAAALLRSHYNFRNNVASNTYSNAEKLFQASNTIAQSGEFPLRAGFRCLSSPALGSHRARVEHQDGPFQESCGVASCLA